MGDNRLQDRILWIGGGGGRGGGVGNGAFLIMGLICIVFNFM